MSAGRGSASIACAARPGSCGRRATSPSRPPPAPPPAGSPQPPSSAFWQASSASPAAWPLRSPRSGSGRCAASGSSRPSCPSSSRSGRARSEPAARSPRRSTRSSTRPASPPTPSSAGPSSRSGWASRSSRRSDEMSQRLRSESFELVVLTTDVQRRVGGNVAEIFDQVADTVRRRHQFSARVKALTSMGRLSAQVLIGLPFAMAGMLTLINHGYMRPLYTTRAGHILIAVGAGDDDGRGADPAAHGQAEDDRMTWLLADRRSCSAAPSSSPFGRRPRAGCRSRPCSAGCRGTAMPLAPSGTDPRAWLRKIGYVAPGGRGEAAEVLRRKLAAAGWSKHLVPEDVAGLKIVLPLAPRTAACSSPPRSTSSRCSSLRSRASRSRRWRTSGSRRSSTCGCAGAATRSCRACRPCSTCSPSRSKRA